MLKGILNKLNKFFSGMIDSVKVNYYANNMNIIKFEMLGHKMLQEDGKIYVFDDLDRNNFTPKTLCINPNIVEEIIYEDDEPESTILFHKKVIIKMKDNCRIELRTAAIK